MRITAVCIMVAAALAVVCGLAFAGSGGEDKALKEMIKQSRLEHANPHTALGCAACHGVNNPQAGPDGKVPFAGGAGIKEACYACHDRSSNIHPVGQLPSMKVPAHLHLEEGRVSCNTCHDMHMQTTKDHLLRGFADGRYKNRPDLCIDCHGEKFVRKNPHVNQKERGLCVFCHQTEPGKMDTERTVRFRYGILRTCNFCHNVVGQGHPVNVDKDVAPPRSLPRDVDGSVTCATCHNPHGTTDTLHFLRREYIVSLEAARNFDPHKNDCLACHGDTPKKGATLDAVYAGLKFKGNVGLLCNSCHGAHSVHPVEVAPAPDMKVPDYLPLDGKGRINCITCHEMNCGGGRVKLRLFDEREGSMKMLCYGCHDEKKFAKTNPHGGIEEGEGCLFCHERQPDRRTDTAATVSFITSMRMICLRCHDRHNHPAGVEHLVMPETDLPRDLPVDDAGMITCITCHNPHIGGEKGSSTALDRRLRRPGDKLCDVCHVANY
ncbi:MAG: cytochrome c3 family protein [Nitrospirae bacterium]|nr:cytochrome c3 family protein [Nitrospirota bacterium]